MKLTRVNIFAALALVLLASGFGLTVNAQTCAPVPVGLVSWYSADGNVLDSRSRNNGTLQNGATFAAGQVGQALSLDGVNDFVDIPDAVSLNNLTTQATLEAWIRPESVGEGFIFAHRQTNQLESFSVRTIDGFLTLIGATNGGSVFVFQTLLPVIELNQFQHIAVTINTTNNTAKAFVNGVEVPFTQLSGVPLGGLALNPVTNNFIGQRQPGLNFFKGLIDEASVYSTELTAAQILAIFNAGTAGKCKPTATVAPSGQVAWFAGDGNTLDISGNGNNGAFDGTSSFAVGKVGQDFNFTGAQIVEAPDNATLDFTNAFTIEMWVNPPQVGEPSGSTMFISKGDFSFANSQSYGILFNSDRRIFNRVGNGSTLDQVGSTSQLPLNTFTHIATTYDGTTLRIYVNGVLDNSQLTSIGTLLNTVAPLIIGGRKFVPFPASTDEVSLYNRALTDAEIASIFNAGIAGKLKDGVTAAGSNVTVSTKSDATVKFPTVTTAGITQQIPLNISSLPALPGGSTFTGLAYDISTSAAFTGTPTLCFTLPSLSAAQFLNLGVLHLEAGVWIDRGVAKNTAARVICASSPTLSPFVIAQVASPTSANANLGGRVLTKGGRGISGERLTLTDSNGLTRTASTSSFGYYLFEDVPAGQTYALSVVAKRYTFADPMRIITLQDDLTDADFVTQEE